MRQESVQHELASELTAFQIADLQLATGQGSALQLKATDFLLQGSASTAASGLTTAILPGATTQAGDINIEVENVYLLDGTQVLSAGLGQGDSGTINLQAQAIEINSGTGPATSSLSSQIFNNSRGNAGDINIDSQTLRLLSGGQITAINFGQGNGGAVNITASEIELRGINLQNQAITLISAAIQSGATGNAGVDDHDATLRGTLGAFTEQYPDSTLLWAFILQLEN